MTSVPRKPRILIVDDDPDFVSDMTVFLSPEFEITSAQNTVQASDSWKRLPPECVLLDLQMPKYFANDSRYEGLSFIAHIKNETADYKNNQIPIIIVTSGAARAHIALALRLGISDIYNKPINVKQLKTTIWSLIESGKGAKSRRLDS